MRMANLMYAPFLSTHRVIYYHQVTDSPVEIYQNSITTQQFENQIINLIDAGFTFTKLSEAVHKAKVGQLRGMTVSLTTDDGFVANYHTILPILKKYQIPVTLFLLGKCLDNKSLAWNHKILIVQQKATENEITTELQSVKGSFGCDITNDLSRSLFSVPMINKDTLADFLWDRFMDESEDEYLLKHRPFLNTDQIYEMIDNGAEVATHGYSHPDFSRLTYSQICSELDLAGAILSRFGSAFVPLFAFPYARIIPLARVQKLCKEMDIEACFGGRYCINDNRGDSVLWQRHKMEQPPRKVDLDLMIKPYLRYAKDMLTL